MPPPPRRRCKRFFRLDTSDGPLITVHPTLASFLPPTFKRAEARSIDAARGADVLELASRKPASRGLEAECPILHHPGGPVLVFSVAQQKPDSFGTPSDDAEMFERNRVGTLQLRTCGLCAHVFTAGALKYRVSRKAIVEKQACWGRTELRERDLKPGNLYESCAVCTFCFQFFEQTICEAPSILPEDSMVQRSAFSTVCSSSGCSPARGTSAPSLVLGTLCEAPPEVLEGIRLQRDRKVASLLGRCLDPEFEERHRQQMRQRRNESFREYRESEIIRLEQMVQSKRAEFNAAKRCGTPSDKDTGGDQASGQRQAVELREAAAPLAVGATTAVGFSAVPSSDDLRPSVSISTSSAAGGATSTSTPRTKDAPVTVHEPFLLSARMQPPRRVSGADVLSTAHDEDAALDGELLMTDDLKQLFAAAANDGSRLAALTGGKSLLAEAKERVREAAERRKLLAASETSGGAARPSKSAANSPPRETRAHALRLRASKVFAAEHEFRAYLAACDLHGAAVDGGKFAQLQEAVLTAHALLLNEHEGGHDVVTVQGADRYSAPASVCRPSTAEPRGDSSVWKELKRAKGRRASRHELHLQNGRHRDDVMRATPGLNEPDVLKYHSAKRLSMYLM